MNLYSRKRFLASALLVLACVGLVTSAVAQRRKTHKLRATAVVEVTTDSKGVVTTHLLPVTILDGGLFNDASVYKATPRPMALENGIVYEAQSAGMPVGTATIISGSNANGWSAIGRWQKIVTVAKKPDTPSEPVTTGDRPTLHRAAGSESPAPSPTPAPGSSDSSSSSPSDDRPILRRPSESSSPTATPSPTPGSTGTASGTSSESGGSNTSASSASSDRPTLHRSAESASSAPTPAASSSAGSSTANQAPPDASDNTATDPDRPALRKHNSPNRGLPPSASQPKSSSTAAGVDSKPAAAAAPAGPRKPMAVPGTKAYAAVSDTEPLDPRSFLFPWKPEEEDAMEPKMRKLLLTQLPKEKVPLTENSLKHVVMRSFDLDLSNDAVLVMSAELPVTVPSTKETPAKFISRYITVIARVDFEGVPQKILSNVTDSTRQDVTPRLELIDAIDVDGDGIGELLFREYGYDDTGFVIYSVGRSTATKLFEGASTRQQ